MAQAGVAAGPLGAANLAVSGVTRLAARHMRVTVLLCIILICGSFAAAGALQMRIGREHGLQQAATLEARHAQEIASGIGGRLDRNAQVAARFANGMLDAANLRAFLASHASALRNVAVIDQTGQLQSALRTPGFLPLPSKMLIAAQTGRTLGVAGSSLLLAFAQNGNVTVVELDLASVFPGAILSHSAVVALNGAILAKGGAWIQTALPPDVPLSAGQAAISNGQLIVVAPLAGWPAAVANTLDVEDAVGAWYGSLPLYLFVILGPALVGAGLAMVFVREFERRARANDTLQRLRNTSSSDARLLIRLAEAERRASEAERSKVEFVAHMSHELRTPLNAIIGFSEIIAHGFFGAPGHPKYIEYARDIGSAGRDLHGKIGDILEFANVEAGRYPIALKAVEVVEIASACVNEMAGRAFSRRIALGVAPMTDALAWADARAVKRILSNLVSNALNFTPDGGRVRVEIIESDTAVIARVRDTGRGFSAQEADHAGKAFTCFERTGAVTGVGLGLAIATALAERMGGEMLLVRNQSQGTTAELRLRKA